MHEEQATDDRSSPFAERLNQAFDHLSDRRRQAIEANLASQGLEGGLKGGIARLLGMSGASTLSDMLSGRIRGQRYRAELADILGVSLAWLEGSDETADTPEWALLPLDAYERWLRRVRIAWQAWFVDQRGGPSATTAMGLRMPSQSGGFALSAAEKSLLAQRLDLDEHDPVLTELSNGAWHAIPFAMQLAIAEELGAPAPENPNHIANGHRLAHETALQKDSVAERLRHQALRYLLPPQLFQITRLSLVTLLAQRRYQGKEETALCDSLELLWRQHLQRQGRPADPVPAAFTQETGRSQWTPLEELMARYEHSDDPQSGDDPYRSQIPAPNS